MLSLGKNVGDQNNEHEPPAGLREANTEKPQIMSQNKVRASHTLPRSTRRMQLRLLRQHQVFHFCYSEDETEMSQFLFFDISIIQTTNTNPWAKHHFWQFWCFLEDNLAPFLLRDLLRKVEKHNACRICLISMFPTRSPILKAAGGSSPRQWQIIKFDIIERFPFMTPSPLYEGPRQRANGAETLTTSEALVRKQLLPTLHLCFKGILTHGFYYFIVF